MPSNVSFENLRVALAALTPPGCASGVVGAEEEALAQLSEAEHLLSKSWAQGRRWEFAAGRQAARTALAHLGVVAKNLARDAEGVPLWPDGLIGSISHCQGVCMAIVGRQHDEQGRLLLGLDVERIDRLSDAAMQRVQHADEVAWVNQYQWRASLLFSLKEAFYKLQYPQWRTRGNFQHLALNPDLEQGTADIVAMDTRFARELGQVHFGFRFVDHSVVSLCWLTLPSES